MNRPTLKKIAAHIASIFMLIAVFGAPIMSHAALPGIECTYTKTADGKTIDSCLIPCDGTTADPCTFDSLLKLIKNIMYYLIYISIPISALAFAYAGWLFMTAGGSSGNISKAWGIFRKVGTGLIVILAAWLIVKTIVDVLLNPDFSPLG